MLNHVAGSIVPKAIDDLRHKPQLNVSLQKLALGILLQAFRDLLSTPKASQEQAQEWREDAIEWFKSRGSHPGSLEWVCSILWINSEVIREWHQSYRQADSSRREQMASKIRRIQMPS